MQLVVLRQKLTISLNLTNFQLQWLSCLTFVNKGLVYCIFDLIQGFVC